MKETTLLRVQALSGLVFAFFLFAHLFNQAVAVAGPERYDALQTGLRRAYQAPVIEIVLVLVPLLTHVGVSVLRMTRRRGAPSPKSIRMRLHRWSGWFLLATFIGHVGATRGASLFFHVFPRFEGVAFTLRWTPAYFWPYYLLLAVGGWYHMLHGLSVAGPVLGVPGLEGLRRKGVFVSFVSVGGVCLVLGILAFGGALFHVPDPANSEYAKLVLQLTS